MNDVPNAMKNAIKQCEKEGTYLPFLSFKDEWKKIMKWYKIISLPLSDDKDRCEKAVKFTKCIYAHKNEVR